MEVRLQKYLSDEKMGIEKNERIMKEQFANVYNPKLYYILK